MKITIFFLHFLLFICTTLENEELSSNFIHNEIKNIQGKENSNFQSIYIITKEIEKFYPLSNEINIYISMLNCEQKNKLKINSTRTDYLQNYNLMMGKSEKFFPLEKKKNAGPLFHNTVTNNKTNLKVNDDIFIRKVYIEKEKHQINLYFMRNQFISHFDDPFIFPNILNFYDINIVFNCNKSDIEDKNLEQNKFLIVETKYNNTDYNEIISTEFEGSLYQEILENPTIKSKIEKLTIVNIIINQITSKQESNINLMNYMLSSQIQIIKSHIDTISKKILPLLYYTPTNLTQQLNLLNESTVNLTKYLSNFNFSKSDIAIDINYSIFLFISVILIGYIILKMITEFKIALERKVK